MAKVLSRVGMFLLVWTIFVQQLVYATENDFSLKDYPLSVYEQHRIEDIRKRLRKNGIDPDSPVSKQKLSPKIVKKMRGSEKAFVRRFGNLIDKAAAMLNINDSDHAAVKSFLLKKYRADFKIVPAVLSGDLSILQKKDTFIQPSNARLESYTRRVLDIIAESGDLLQKERIHSSDNSKALLIKKSRAMTESHIGTIIIQNPIPSATLVFNCGGYSVFGLESDLCDPIAGNCGIFIRDTSNIILLNCGTSFFQTGIYVRDSKNVQMINSTAMSNVRGIRVQDSEDVAVWMSDTSYNTTDGLQLRNSDHVQIFASDFDLNGRNGVDQNGGKETLYTVSKASFNHLNGFEVDDGQNVIGGVREDAGHSVTFHGCETLWNSVAGISIDDTADFSVVACKMTGDIINNPDPYGLLVGASDFGVIGGNVGKGHVYDLMIHSSSGTGTYMLEANKNDFNTTFIGP